MGLVRWGRGDTYGVPPCGWPAPAGASGAVGVRAPEVAPCAALGVAPSLSRRRPCPAPAGAGGGGGGGAPPAGASTAGPAGAATGAAPSCLYSSSSSMRRGPSAPTGALGATSLCPGTKRGSGMTRRRGGMYADVICSVIIVCTVADSPCQNDRAALDPFGSSAMRGQNWRIHARASSPTLPPSSTTKAIKRGASCFGG